MVKTIRGADYFRAGLGVRVHACLETPKNLRHAHDFLEIALVRKGRGMHMVGRDRFELTTGDIFVINSHVPHHYRDTKNLEIRYMLLSPRLMKKYIGRLKRVPGFYGFFLIEPLFRRETRFSQHLHLGHDDARHTGALLDRIETEIAAESPGYKLVVESLTVEFLVTVSRLYHGFSVKHIPHKELASKRNAVDDVIAFIEDHYSEDIRLSDLARCGCLQSEYLCRVFRKATGLTMIEYLTRVRIQKACELLADPALSVTAVCYKTGFNDLSHFSRTFRKVMRVSPSGFRKKSIIGNK